ESSKSSPMWKLLVCSLLVSALGSCSSNTSAGSDADTTGAATEGPAMVQQVFVPEVLEESGSTIVRYGLAFGSHPELPDDDGVVTSAPAIGSKPIRIVLDERIPGNPLNEIAC